MRTDAAITIAKTTGALLLLLVVLPFTLTLTLVALLQLVVVRPVAGSPSTRARSWSAAAPTTIGP